MHRGGWVFNLIGLRNQARISVTQNGFFLFPLQVDEVQIYRGIRRARSLCAFSKKEELAQNQGKLTKAPFFSPFLLSFAAESLQNQSGNCRRRPF